MADHADTYHPPPPAAEEVGNLDSAEMEKMAEVDAKTDAKAFPSGNTALARAFAEAFQDKTHIRSLEDKLKDQAQLLQLFEDSASSPHAAIASLGTRALAGAASAEQRRYAEDTMLRLLATAAKTLPGRAPECVELLRAAEHKVPPAQRQWASLSPNSCSC